MVRKSYPLVWFGLAFLTLVLFVFRNNLSALEGTAPATILSAGPEPKVTAMQMDGFKTWAPCVARRKFERKLPSRKVMVALDNNETTQIGPL